MKPVQIEFLMVDHLSARLDKAVGKIERMSQQASSANRQIRELDRSGSLLNNTVGKLAAAFTIKELVSNITKVRGEFQQLEVSFQTMLGSAEKADTLMQQLVHTAATTPFGLEDVAQGAKQLLAYGFGAEKVNETLIRLGDIAAGLSIPLNDLVYLYGTTMSQGRLYTQDLNQFTGRGIPMIAPAAQQVLENRFAVPPVYMFVHLFRFERMAAPAERHGIPRLLLLFGIEKERTVEIENNTVTTQFHAVTS